jgi:peroxiredoxin (alkyl hydroperoxide reductase subunit C)
MEIEINKAIPDFTLEAFHNQSFKKIRLADYKGKWLVLFFYPADFTFVCPTELSELADHYEKFKELETEILSVSTDTAFVHKAWHDNSPAIKKIQFPMLADPTAELTKAFGVYIAEEGLPRRGTFIIDPDGILKAYEVHDNSIGRSATELIRKIEASRFVRENKGEACPASWHKGEKTLTPGIDLVGKI